MRNPELWARIEAYGFDHPDFAGKLAEGEHWSRSDAQGAIREYLRFVYLTQVGTNPATPPIPVDKVWHLHMTHTRDYWERFCDGVLGAKLHHEPGRDAGEVERHRAQYLATRSLYTQEFGQEPPAKYWPLGRAKPQSGTPMAVGIIGMMLGAILLQEHPLAGVGVMLGGVGMIVWWSHRRTRRLRQRSDGAGFCGACASGTKADAASCSADCGGGGCGGD
jgi:hypothetical protein